MTPRSKEEAEALFITQLRLVPLTARRYFPLCREDPELLQAGRIGLWQGAQRWDGARPFSPYAQVCIRNAMTDHLRREGRAQRPLPLPPEPQASTMERELADRALYRRIRTAWPAGSRQRLVLFALADAWPKAPLARAMGLSSKQLTTLARRAWRQVPPEA